ncbi:MAG: CAP domain-containing protein [Leptolyngbyaceae cyanobacterium SM2_3_12]|nr:CAP domain-containing protein [Leptolyngbyaceae cyanobacterium SM2_3_12]
MGRYHLAIVKTSLAVGLLGLGALGLSMTSPARAVALVPDPGNAHQPPVQLAQISPNVLEDLLTRINAERQRVGAPPLRINPQLTTAAQRHAQDMAQNRQISHNGSDGSTMQSRIEDARYPWTTIGENVAMGQATPAAVMTSWMNSPGHRQNILNPDFTELGLSYAEAAGRLYWVQVFAAPR